jgi:hypothetical protein
VRFSTDDRVTVTDPKSWHYGEHGFVSELAFDSMARPVCIVELPARNTSAPFTVDQLDFTEKESV